MLKKFLPSSNRPPTRGSALPRFFLESCTCLIPASFVDTVRAFTVGGVRDIAAIRGVAIGVGGNVTFYGVPPLLQNSHDPHPVSVHCWSEVARADLTRRMWDMTMAQHGSSRRH